MFWTMPKSGQEISDAIISFDPITLERKPVLKSDVIAEFVSLNNQRAVRIIEKIPEREGVLEADAVDQLLITTHCEMQRISEEFQHGQRVAELLQPLLRALRSGGETSIRIVDIGCGTGFIVRWLSAQAMLGDDVEIIGADYNAALIKEAKRLAELEHLACSFVEANAFRLDHPAAIYISTGILHHFRGQELIELLKQHNRQETLAFVHFDFHPSPLAPIGSWLFHAVRMRQPLAKHDGVLSAIRAHKSRDLLEAAKVAAPEFISTIYGTQLWGLPIPRVFHALVGLRSAYRERFLQYMGSRIASLGKIE
ncbi:MAG: class I SAM-dependent methyltransferase [Acidobacteria bacterium]|nr:class I SAM-dependent methyltransferase [Acidobacteriota bacterium]